MKRRRVYQMLVVGYLTCWVLPDPALAMRQYAAKQHRFMQRDPVASERPTQLQPRFGMNCYASPRLAPMGIVEPGGPVSSHSTDLHAQDVNLGDKLADWWSALDFRSYSKAGQICSDGSATAIASIQSFVLALLKPSCCDPPCGPSRERVCSMLITVSCSPSDFCQQSDNLPQQCAYEGSCVGLCMSKPTTSAPALDGSAQVAAVPWDLVETE